MKAFKMKKKVMIPVVAALAATMLMTACGRSGSSAGFSGYAEKNESYAPTEAVAEDIWDGEEWEQEASGAAYEEDVAVSEPSSAAPVLADDKLVHTCHLEIQTLKYTEDAASIRDLIKKHSGIIENESETNDGYSWSDLYWYGEEDDNRNRMDLYLVARIPTDSYEAFVEEIAGIGKVISRTQSTDNISRAYYDTETHIKALEIEEERLLSMMESAETIEEMIMVEERLTQVQSELNTEKGWLAEMDTDIAYSTVTINLREVREYSNEGPSYEAPTFGERVRESFSKAWSGFLGVLELILHVIIRLWPFILIGLVVFFVIRHIVKKHRARK